MSKESSLHAPESPVDKTKTDNEFLDDVSRPTGDGADAEFGGPEARKALERKLLMKLDLRYAGILPHPVMLTPV